MLWTIFMMMLILWLFGVLHSSYFGGYIHILLILAIIVLILRVILGRKAI